MSDERKKILEMLEAGIINQEDAIRLLEAVGEQKGPAAEKPTPSLTLYPEPTVPPEAPACPEPELPVEPAESLVPLQTDGTPYDYPGITGEKIKSLHISWVAGPVEVRPGQDDSLKVTEYANRPLSEDEKLQMELENGKLTIRWTGKQNWRGSFKTIMGLSKHLVVELPQSTGRLDEAEINAVSGNVFVQDLSGGDITVSAVSGQVNAVNLTGDDVTLTSVSGTVKAQNTAGDDLSFNSTSGRLEIDGFQGNDVSLHTVSGKIMAKGQGNDISVNSVSGGIDLGLYALPEDLSLNTVSGRASVTLPEDPRGFTVNYSTTSGTLKSDFPLAGNLGKRSGDAQYGEGKCDINFHTMSGAMEIKKA